MGEVKTFQRDLSGYDTVFGRARSYWCPIGNEALSSTVFDRPIYSAPKRVSAPRQTMYCTEQTKRNFQKNSWFGKKATCQVLITVRDLGVYLDADLTMTAQSLLPYEHVSRHFGRYAACSVLWQRTLCWRCFVHSSSAKLTVTAQYWPGSLCHSLIDSSQCSTLPLVSCFRQDGQNMWRHFSTTFIGWRFRRESSSVSVFWRTVVYT